MMLETKINLKIYLLKKMWRQSSVPNLPFRNKILVIAAKYYTKADIKILGSCPSLLGFFTLTH